MILVHLDHEFIARIYYACNHYHVLTDVELSMHLPGISDTSLGGLGLSRKMLHMYMQSNMYHCNTARSK